MPVFVIVGVRSAPRFRGRCHGMVHCLSVSILHRCNSFVGIHADRAVRDGNETTVRQSRLSASDDGRVLGEADGVADVGVKGSDGEGGQRD